MEKNALKFSCKLESCIFAIALKEKRLYELRLASIAQLVEQLICNQLVGGSSPSAGSIRFTCSNNFGAGVRRSWRAGADCKSVALS